MGSKAGGKIDYEDADHDLEDLLDYSDNSDDSDDSDDLDDESEEESPSSSEDLSEDDSSDGDHDEGHDESDEENLDGRPIKRTDEEQEALREQRRARRAQKKQAARDREERMRRELAARDRMIEELTGRLNVIERRTGNTDLAQVDNAIGQLRQAYSQVQAQLKAAAESGDGDSLVSAQENMYQIRRRSEELANIRQALTRAQQPTAPPLDPRLVLNAQTWMDQNRWFKPEGTDRESRLVRRLDAELEEEGWKPTDPSYWKELTARVKKELPERFSPVYNRDSKEAPPRRKQIVGGSGTNNSSPTKKSSNRVNLSKERVEAIKAAGLWNNPKDRERAIKEFQNHDSRNAE